MPWPRHLSVVLQAWFPGQEAGNSIVDVLFGAVNPGGKLPMIIPTALKDTPSYENFPGDLKRMQVSYEEGWSIGYRYYDKHPTKVLFPFGFGLSYSKFRFVTSCYNKDL
jgi:beta-glucosidase